MDLCSATPGLRRWALSVVTLAAAVVVGVMPGSATAGCCYGTAEWSPAGTYTGGLAALRASSFGLGSGSPFVVAPVWVLTSSSEWVEQGLGRDPSHGLHWYWAESSNCAGYQEHFPGLSTSYSTSYNSKISYNNGGKWAVYRNGSFVANSSTCHNSTVYHAATGIEASVSGDTGSGSSVSLQKRGSDGVTWSYNWGGATLLQSSASASWISQYASLNWSKP